MSTDSHISLKTAPFSDSPRHRRQVLAATMSILTISVAAVAAPTFAKTATTVSIAPSAVRINAGTAPSFTYEVSDSPSGARIYLQREFGTKKVWKTVMALPTGSASVTAPKVGIGRWVYRIALVEGHKVLAASKRRSVYAYAEIPMAQMCTDCTDSGTVEVGATLYQYAFLSDNVGFLGDPAVYPDYDQAQEWNPRPSCRWLDLTFAAGEGAQTDGATTYLRVLQSASDPVNASTPAGSVGHAHVVLDGGPFSIDTSYNQSEGYYVTFNGTASCYTATGK